MTTYVPPPETSYRLPSVLHRVVGGTLRAMPLAIFYLGWPYAGRLVAARIGVPFPYPYETVLLVGVGLVALAIARYFAKPTRLYGPVSLGYAGALLGYFLWIAGRSTVSLAFSSVSVAVTFTDVVLVLAIVPVLMIARALVTCVEDGLRPRERYPFDFPA